MTKRRRFTAEEKVRILREHLENQVSISDLAKSHHINPVVIHRWKKVLFENALDGFSGQHKKRNGKSVKEKQLENKVTKMQEVITELSTEVVDLKKKYFGAI